MAGRNCIISIEDYGERRVIATMVSHGMSVINFGNDESQSRRGKHFLTYKRTSGSFDLDLQFRNWEEQNDTMKWLQDYMILVANPWRRCNPVRVMIPSIDFDKTGVLEGDLEFGDKNAKIIYTASLKFMGSRDPLDLKNDRNYSIFLLPKVVSDKSDPAYDPALPYLYPAGSQLTGVQLGDDTKEYDDLPWIDPRTGKPGGI